MKCSKYKRIYQNSSIFCQTVEEDDSTTASQLVTYIVEIVREQT